MTKLQALIEKLSELFELEKADLDFGIHRIIKSKHKQIRNYLTHRLPKRVEEELGKVAAETAASELDELQSQVVSSFGDTAIDADGNLSDSFAATPLGQQYNAAREASANYSVSSQTENEVYSHLLEFFSRYYQDADFMSLRRRTAGRESYSIPYNGEEVVLHWANKDQYYIKSSEDLKDYTFTLPEANKKQPTRVQFKLTRMDAIANNNKANRIFQLDTETQIIDDENGLVIPFHFAEGKKRAKAAVEQWEQSVLDALPTKWQKRLASNDDTYTGDGERTILQKHLRNYTKKNTSDYFIHKDLGGFLRRELDFYIKNEVMYLDDVDSRPASYLENEIRKIKAIRAVAGDLIDFLAQFENFQKKLWQKKKFVIETNYCITLDRIPEELYPEIAANDAQREEWVKLFAIDEIKGDNKTPGYSIPMSVEFLKAHQNLSIDSSLFTRKFFYQAVGRVSDLDQLISGQAFHTDNFHSLSLSARSLHQSQRFIYIDPPYNKEDDQFIYKDNYEHSSWMSMIYDRLMLAHSCLAQDGIIAMSIDRSEAHRLTLIGDAIFGEGNRIAEFVWEKGRKNDSKHVSLTHEYFLVYAKNYDHFKAAVPQWREAKEGVPETISEFERLKTIYGENYEEIKDELLKFVIRKLDPNAARSILLFSKIDEGGPFRDDSDMSWPKPGGPKYEVPNPSTGDIAAVPANGWRWTQATLLSMLDRGELDFDPEVPTRLRKKRYLTDFDDQVKSTVIYKHSKAATRQLRDTMGGDVFPNPKDANLIASLIDYMSPRGTTVLDFFAGSGVSGEAAITLGRNSGLARKYWLTEMGEYFDTVLLPRLRRVAYSSEWKRGRPVKKDGCTQLIKYIRLESYEDALNNLTLQDQAPDLLGQQSEEVQDDYLLRYSLDVETRGSLLDCQKFERPFDYTLKIYNRETGQAEPKKVDLPETFNYLLGLKVRTMQMKEGVLVVEGENPAGETVLVLWRNVDEMPNKKLDKFVSKTLRVNTADTEYAAIYINGDTTLADPHKKVLLTEEVFHDLMFDVEDV